MHSFNHDIFLYRLCKMSVSHQGPNVGLCIRDMCYLNFNWIVWVLFHYTSLLTSLTSVFSSSLWRCAKETQTRGAPGDTCVSCDVWLERMVKCFYLLCNGWRFHTHTRRILSVVIWVRELLEPTTTFSVCTSIRVSACVWLFTRQWGNAT